MIQFGCSMKLHLVGRNALNYWRWFLQSVKVAVLKRINVEIVQSFPKELQFICDFLDTQSKYLDKFLVAYWCCGRKLRGIFSNIFDPPQLFNSIPECLIVAFCFLISFNPFHTKICFQCWTLIFSKFLFLLSKLRGNRLGVVHTIPGYFSSCCFFWDCFAVYCNLLVASLFITLWSLIKIWSMASVPVWELSS